MTIYPYKLLMCYTLYSYAIWWVLIGLRARRTGMIDLCQFVRELIYAPFVGAICLGIGWLIWIVLIPSIGEILIALSIMLGACGVLGLLGYYVIRPSVNAAIGIAKPISSKICVVLYKRK